MKHHTIKLKQDGRIEFLNPPPFPVAVNKSRQRFSEIVPVNIPLRIAFRILRRLFGETGACSIWTRQWVCRWECRILLGRFKGAVRRSMNRERLLQWERDVWADVRHEPKVDL